MTEYRWLPTECVPKGYPVKILKGTFYFADGNSLYIPDNALVNNGWGEVGSTHLLDKEEYAIPEKMSIAWFSYTENKFYVDTLALPTDKLSEFFKTGFNSPTADGKATYDRIMVGLAPGGNISLWVGGEGVVHLVGHLQAKTGNIPWKDFADPHDTATREEHVKKTLEATLTADELTLLHEKGVPAGLWVKYRKTYNWGMQALCSGKVENAWIKGFNGEMQYEPLLAGKGVLTAAARPVCRSIKIKWAASNGRKYFALVQFNEAETWAAFEQLTAGDEAKPLTLQIRVNDLNQNVSLLLLNNKEYLPLQKAAIKVYAI